MGKTFMGLSRKVGPQASVPFPGKEAPRAGSPILKDSNWFLQCPLKLPHSKEGPQVSCTLMYGMRQLLNVLKGNLLTSP